MRLSIILEYVILAQAGIHYLNAGLPHAQGDEAGDDIHKELA